MRAQSVRIMAPIPARRGRRRGAQSETDGSRPAGNPRIGRLGRRQGGAAIALGKDVSGRPLVSDLAKMPHLLIAGATGSGKSVCINAIISSILYHASPRDVRLLMIDPKIVELKIFNVLPHMLIPVVTEAKKVPAALKWLLKEMGNALPDLCQGRRAHISSFNSRKKSAREGVPPAKPSPRSTWPPSRDVEVPEHMSMSSPSFDELAD